MALIQASGATVSGRSGSCSCRGLFPWSRSPWPPQPSAHMWSRGCVQPPGHRDTGPSLEGLDISRSGGGSALQAAVRQRGDCPGPFSLSSPQPEGHYAADTWGTSPAAGLRCRAGGPETAPSLASAGAAGLRAWPYPAPTPPPALPVGNEDTGRALPRGAAGRPGGGWRVAQGLLVPRVSAPAPSRAPAPARASGPARSVCLVSVQSPLSESGRF